MMDKQDSPAPLECWMPGGDTGLVVKDGVRHVRFNLRRGAQRLVEGAQAVTHADDRASVPGPLALLSEPLDFAVRTTARLLRTVDRAAVDLLSSDGPYRALEVPLRSSASYFEGGLEDRAIRVFTHDHYWRYRHWLAMKGLTDVFVREQGIERAGRELAAACASGAGREGALDDDHFRWLAHIVRVLASSEVMVWTVGPDHEISIATAELAWKVAVCTVLAGEIAPGLPELQPKKQTITALRLADEIWVATQESWGQDVAIGASVVRLARWLNFALRHV